MLKKKDEDYFATKTAFDVAVGSVSGRASESENSVKTRSLEGSEVYVGKLSRGQGGIL